MNSQCIDRVRAPRIRNWAVCSGVLWLLLVPGLRWYGPPQPVWSVKLRDQEQIAGSSPDGRVMMTRRNVGQHVEYRFWDAVAGTRREGHFPCSLTHQNSVALSDDGELFALLEGEDNAAELIVSATRTGELKLRISLQPDSLYADRFPDPGSPWAGQQIVFSPDRKKIAVAGKSGSIYRLTTQVIDLESGQIMFRQATVGDSAKLSLDFNRDSSSLLHFMGRQPEQQRRNTHEVSWEWVELASGRKRAVPLSDCVGSASAHLEGAAYFLDDDQTLVGGTIGVSREPVDSGQHFPECRAVQLWDAVTTQIIATFPDEELLQVAPDRRDFYARRRRNGTLPNVIVRDAGTGKVIAEWRARELDREGRLCLLEAPEPRAAIVTSQPEWSFGWIFRGQTTVIDPATGETLCKAPGAGMSHLSPDARLLITQAGPEIRKIFTQTRINWPWTMSAYLVNAAMPWTTAMGWALVLAMPLGWLASRLIRRASRDDDPTGRSATQRTCPACRKLTPVRMPRCYHCGQVIPDVSGAGVDS